MCTTAAVQLNIYLQCGGHTCSGDYANNVKVCVVVLVVALLNPVSL